MMRFALVSDVHGNRRALDAVPCDLEQTSPDAVVHGGDLARLLRGPERRDAEMRDTNATCDRSVITALALKNAASRTMP
jgi:predicted phosphodiesterase